MSTATSRSGGTSSAPRRRCAPRRARRSSATSTAGTGPSAWSIGLGGRIGDDLLGRLEELLGDLPAETTGAPEPVVLSENGSRVRIHTKQSDQAHLVIGARGYPHGHPDRYAVQLLSTVLGGGMSSRLFTEVRERRGLAYYVFCGANSYADAGTLAAQAGVDLNRIDEAVETIVEELRRVVSESVPTDELEKARAFAKGRFVLGLESPHATIMFGLRREVLEGRAIEPEEVLAGLDAVTVEDVQRVAADILGGDLRLAVIGPFDEPERVREAARRLTAGLAVSQRLGLKLKVIVPFVSLVNDGAPATGKRLARLLADRERLARGSAVRRPRSRSAARPLDGLGARDLLEQERRARPGDCGACRDSVRRRAQAPAIAVPRSCSNQSAPWSSSRSVVTSTRSSRLHAVVSFGSSPTAYATSRSS